MHPADFSRLCKGDVSSAESKAPEDTAATTWRHRSSVSAHAVGAMVLLLLLLLVLMRPWRSSKADTSSVRCAGRAVFLLCLIVGVVQHARHYEAIRNSETPNFANMLFRDMAIEDSVPHLEEDLASEKRV